MVRMFRFFLRSLVRLYFFCRYRVTVDGLQGLNETHSVLFLPNHVSALDPALLMLLLDKSHGPIPLATETMFTMPVVGWVLRRVGAIAMPDFDTGGNEYTRLMAQKSLEKIVRGLERGKNFIVYPSGRLKRSPKEEIGGALAAYFIATNAPKATIVGIRTQGLWGSSFSKVVMGPTSRLQYSLKHAALNLVKNGLFFSPKRKVKITFEVLKNLPLQEKMAFNQALEQWYNRTIEPLYLVPEKWWSKQVPTLWKSTSDQLRKEVRTLTAAEKAIVNEVISHLSKRNDIAPDLDLIDDLGLDSLDMIDLLASLGDHFDTRQIRPEELTTVGRLYELLAIEHPTEISIKSLAWPSEKRLASAYGTSNHLLELFVDRARATPALIAGADDTGKMWSYQMVHRAASVLSEYLLQFPEDRIGVLLPATMMANILVLAIWMAGKVPVMVNWTLGHRYVNETLQLTGVRRVVTSEKFLRAAKSMDIVGIENSLLFLENIKSQISLWQKLQGFIRSKKEYRGDSTQEAVVLFTSGTEGKPKAVPLTFANIAENQRAALASLPLQAEDVMLSFLPPFHSFGFSITGLLPLLAGIRAVFVPDPTDAMRLVRAALAAKVTLMCGAPTFLQAIMQRLPQEGIPSLRYVISGAERIPDALSAIIQSRQLTLLEGYGITECSPILTLNRPNEKAFGVGRPLPGVEMKIVHPETHQEVPLGEQGLVIVRGPNVFHGYLNQTAIPSPFLKINEEEWYMTGDLGYMLPSCHLILVGRLKRFVKMGAEMINLLGVENALLHALAPEIQEPVLAIVPKETEARCQLILVTTLPLDRQTVNDCLLKAGFSRLVKIDEVRRLAEIPLLGTGKINYNLLTGF